MFSFLRIFAKLLCLIAMIFLVGCAPSTQSATPPLQTQTVDIWVWDETFNVKAAKMAAHHLHYSTFPLPLSTSFWNFSHQSVF